MATKYYFQSTNSYTTCDAATSQDLGLSVSSGTANAGNSFASYLEVLTFDVFVSSGMSASQNINCSISVNAITANTQFRYRLQQVNPAGCGVLNSSSYSTVYNTTGVKTDTLTLAWTGSSGILRVSIEHYNISAPPFPPPGVTVDLNSSSFIELPDPASNVSRRMNLVRDCWWMMSSGATYILNESSQISAKNVGLYRSIEETVGSSDSTYIQNGTTTGGSYMFRIANDHVTPDKVRIRIRGKYGSGGSTDLTLNLYINGVVLSSVATITSGSTIQTSEVLITLNDYQRRGILNGRTNNYYDFCQLEFSGAGTTVQHARIYAIEIYYENDTYNEYLNHRASVPGAVTFSLFPTVAQVINSNWQTDAGVTFASGDTVLIQQYASGVDADTRYIRCIHEPYLNTFSVLPSAAAAIANSYSLPSGNLTLHFDLGNNLDANTQLNRANLYLRMSVPPSASVGNYRDVYEVHGFNPNFSGGNIMWGGGSIVEQSGFRTYTTELCWLKPDLYTNVPRSGDISHPYLRVSESLSGLQLRVFGIPSGAYLSAAELRVEAQNDAALNLFVSGVTPTSGYDYQNLYTYGGASGTTNTLNLFVKNLQASSTLPLYMYGKAGLSGTQNLHILGEPAVITSKNLFIAGIPPSATKDLYIMGGTWSQDILPLHTYSSPRPSAVKGLNLFTYATTNSGVRDTQDLFINSTDPQYILNLHTLGAGGSKTETLPLIMGGIAAGFTPGYMNLYAHNVYSSATKSLQLMIKNTGTPYSGTLPLIIGRENEGVPGAIPLFIKTITGYPTSGNMDMYIKSAYGTTSTFYSIGDSYVSATSGNANYGTSQLLRVNP